MSYPSVIRQLFASYWSVIQQLSSSCMLKCPLIPIDVHAEAYWGLTKDAAINNDRSLWIYSRITPIPLIVILIEFPCFVECAAKLFMCMPSGPGKKFT